MPRSAPGFLDLNTGPFEPGRARSLVDFEGPMLVTSGIISAQTTLMGRAAIELLGEGDLFPVGEGPDAMPSGEVSFVVLESARVYLFDDQLDALISKRPELGASLLDGAAKGRRRQLMHRAVAQLPRVEDRVLGILWMVAHRWGTVTPDGVSVQFHWLTHTMLGQLIGARRPTVSTALADLERSGALTREGRSYLLDPGLRERFAPSAPRHG